MSRIQRLLSITLAAVLGPGCVIVSSSSNTPPRDSGHDAFVVPPRDGAGVDASELPVLTREEATRGLLASIGTNVVLPTYREIARGAATLESATAAYAASGSVDDRDAARAAWTSLMGAVERAELLQFGPAGMAIPEVLGGRGLRDEVYVFPINRCFVDVAAQQRTFDDLEALSAQPTFARGLGAVEYQLFAADTAHGCDPGAATRVDDVAWDDLGEDGVRRLRAEAAHGDAQLVRRAADTLVAAWDGGGFTAQLASAGESGSVYPTTQAAMNAIYWAMVYSDRAVKDMKLGVPTGLSDLCGAPSCPHLLESPWAGRSVEHVAANLVGLQQVFLGGPVGTPAIGFDDLLRAIDQAALAAEMDAAIAAAIETASAIPSVDAASFATHEAALEALYAAVRTVTTLLKVDLAGILAFTPPPGAGEDND